MTGYYRIARAKHELLHPLNNIGVDYGIEPISSLLRCCFHNSNRKVTKKTEISLIFRTSHNNKNSE